MSSSTPSRAGIALRSPWRGWLRAEVGTSQRVERLTRIISGSGLVEVQTRCDALSELVELVLSTEPNERELARTAFLEYDTWVSILQLALQPWKTREELAFCVKALQAASMILWNIRDPILLAYLLSRDALRQVILAAPLCCGSGSPDDDHNRDLVEESDLLPSYLSLLRTVCLRLDASSLPLVFPDEGDSFPLLSGATQFLDDHDRLIRAAAHGIILALVHISAEAPELDRFLAREVEEKDSFARHCLTNLQRAAIAGLSADTDRTAAAATELDDAFEFLNELVKQAGPRVQVALLAQLRDQLLTPWLVAAANGERIDLTASDAIRLFIYFMECAQSALVCSEFCAALVRSDQRTALLSRLITTRWSNGELIAEHERLRCMTAYAASLRHCVDARETLSALIDTACQHEMCIQLDPGREFWRSVFDEKAVVTGGAAATLELTLLRLVISVGDPERLSLIAPPVFQLYRERLGDIQARLEQNSQYARHLGRVLADAQERELLRNDLLQLLSRRCLPVFGPKSVAHKHKSEQADEPDVCMEQVAADLGFWLLAHAMRDRSERNITFPMPGDAQDRESYTTLQFELRFVQYLQVALADDTAHDVDELLAPLQACERARADLTRWSPQSEDAMTLAHTDVFSCLLGGKRMLCAVDEHQSKMLVVGEALEVGGFQPLIWIPLEHILDVTEPEQTQSSSSEAWCVLIQRTDLEPVLNLVFESEALARDFVTHVAKRFPQAAAWRATLLREALLIPIP